MGPVLQGYDNSLCCVCVRERQREREMPDGVSE